MRRLMLVSALAMCLAACGGSDGSETQNAGRTISAETISTNDVTAIDAVTGEAANMAADIDITRELAEAANGAEAATNAAAPRRSETSNPSPRPAEPAAPATAPATPPEANAAE